MSNEISGGVQIMAFGNPQTCADTQRVGDMVKAGQSSLRELPANRILTFSVSEYDVIGSNGRLAVCKPFFISTRLTAGHAYDLKFYMTEDATTTYCRFNLTDADSGAAVPLILREGKGSHTLSPLTGTASCKPNAAVDAL